MERSTTPYWLFFVFEEASTVFFIFAKHFCESCVELPSQRLPQVFFLTMADETPQAGKPVPPWLRKPGEGGGTTPAARPAAPTTAPKAPSPSVETDVAVADTPVEAPAAPAKKKKAKLLAVVHMEGCTGCDVCVEFCPVDCIYHIPGPEHILHANPHAAVNGVVIIDEDVCIGCKLCAKYCPWDTIEMIDSDELQLARAAGFTY
jgi:ferredoxin